MSEMMESTGNVKISDDVIATIANVAISEVNGVSKKITNPESKNILGKRAIARGVKVIPITNDSISLEVDVCVLYGAKIAEVAWHIQDNVKEHVESMTNLTVEKVNVHVVNVEMEKSEAKKEESKDFDDAIEIIE